MYWNISRLRNTGSILYRDYVSRDILSKVLFIARMINECTRCLRVLMYSMQSRETILTSSEGTQVKCFEQKKGSTIT